MSSTRAAGIPGTPAPAQASPRRLRLPSFSVQILLGLALGVLLGWAALAMGPQADGETPNGLTTTLATVGSSFVTLLDRKSVV